MSMTMDRYDRAILDVLQREGRITTSSLPSCVNLSESACLRECAAWRKRG